MREISVSFRPVELNFDFSDARHVYERGGRGALKRWLDHRAKTCCGSAAYVDDTAIEGLVTAIEKQQSAI